MSGIVQPYLNGHPASTIAPWGGLTYSERFTGGCWEAAWEMRVPTGWHHPLVRRGVAVELRVGGWVVWSGELTEPDRDSGRVTAQGWSRAAEQYSALNSDGSAATNVSVATAQAISRGMPWATSVLPSWPAHANPVAAEEFDGVNKVSALWDAASEASGRFWGVGADRRPYAVERPTSPSWRAAPGTVVLGVADDDYVSHLVGRYRRTAAEGGGYATVTRGNAAAAARWGRREQQVDLTPRKAMTAATAAAVLDGMLSRLEPRPGYSNGFEVIADQVTTLGGQRSFLPLIRAGHGLRLDGVVNESLNPVPYHDIVIGEIRHEPEAGTAYIEPLGLAARNHTAVLEGTDKPALVA